MFKILLGNKADKGEEIVVKQADIDAFCTEMNLKYFEVRVSRLRCQPLRARTWIRQCN